MLRFAIAAAAFFMFAPSVAHAQCGAMFAEIAQQGRAVRYALDQGARISGPERPMRASSSLVTNTRGLAEALDDAADFTETAGTRDTYADGYAEEEDWLESIAQLRADLEAILPLVRVSAQLEPSTRAELRRIAVSAATMRRGHCY